MKTKRNLSGIYIRTKTSDGSFDNICFEDLTVAQQNDFLETKDIDWIKSLCFGLANTLTIIGDQFNIINE